MTRLFNGTCDNCQKFKPRVATVYPKKEGRYPFQLCENCRVELKGKFILAPQHKSVGKSPPLR